MQHELQPTVDYAERKVFNRVSIPSPDGQSSRRLWHNATVDSSSCLQVQDRKRVLICVVRYIVVGACSLLIHLYVFYEFDIQIFFDVVIVMRWRLALGQARNTKCQCAQAHVRPLIT